MEIRIRYDGSRKTFDIDADEFTIMIEHDYEERKAKAAPGEIVERRTPQEIMDAEFNRPEYNNWHRHTRHSAPTAHCRKLDGSVGSYTTEDDEYDDGGNTIEEFPDTYEPIARELRENDEETRALICSLLKPRQAELVIAVVLDGVPQKEIAAREGVSPSAITQRLKTAIKKLESILEKP